MDDTLRAAVDALDYRALFDQSPNLFMIIDAQLRIVTVNDAYAAGTMVRRADVEGRPLFEVFPDNPDDADATGTSNLRSSIMRVFRNKRDDMMPLQRYDVQRPDGSGFEERHWAVINHPVFDDQGEVQWIIHRAEDVSEFVKLQRQGGLSELTLNQLREANATLEQRNEENSALQRALMKRSEELASTSAFLDAIIENIPAMIAVKDAADLRFTLLNRAGEDLTGITRQEAIGKSDYDFKPPEEAAQHIAIDRAVLASGRLQVVEEEKLQSRTKGQRVMRTHKIGVRDENDEPRFLLVMSEDITERVEAKAKLAATEEQLRQSMKMEAIGNLTGGLAHDFNNLLSIVIGNLDLLRESLDKGSPSDNLADEALSAALRGAELTRRLLAFARKQPLQPKLLDLNETVTGVTRLLSRTLGSQIEIMHELGSGIWPANVDPAQLEAALVNLATNARDAMPNGGALRISTDNRHLDEDYVSLHPGLVAGDYSMLAVSDTGTGMRKEIADQIFEPFFTTKREGKGTGLGLSMVFGFMKQSGGHINVYSEEGVGTTFRLYFPRVDGQAETERPAVTGAIPRGHETILAVEDNPGLRALVVRQLTQLGYTCLEAQDGPSALKVLAKEKVDLLFTDVVMPGGMSGYELGREARRLWPHLKVLLTSGFPEEKLNGNGSPPWNMRLLIKPYRKEDLARVMRQVIEEAT